MAAAASNSTPPFVSSIIYDSTKGDGYAFLTKEEWGKLADSEGLISAYTTDIGPSLFTTSNRHYFKIMGLGLNPTYDKINALVKKFILPKDVTVTVQGLGNFRNRQ